MKSRVAELNQNSQSNPNGLFHFLLDSPQHYLTLRWAAATPFPSRLTESLRFACDFLSKQLDGGNLTNPFFGDIKQIDLLAGASSGGLNALVLAQYESFNEGITQALEMWRQLLDRYASFQNNLTPRFFKAMAGQCSFLGTAGDEIVRHYCHGEKKTLADLPNRVAIMTAQLDSGPNPHKRNTVLRRWKPVVYHNFRTTHGQKHQTNLDPGFAGIALVPKVKQSDSDETTISPPLDQIQLHELARFTSILPIASSIFQGPNSLHGVSAAPNPTKASPAQHSSGFINGGLFANNPSLAASITATSHGIHADQIAVISLGNGRQAIEYAEIEAEDLGYEPWLNHRERKGLLLDIVLDIGVDAVNTYCSMLMGNVWDDTSILGGRFLRDDIWIDREFMTQTLFENNREWQEFRIDEALGLQRYFFEDALGNQFRNFFTHYWTPAPL